MFFLIVIIQIYTSIHFDFSFALQKQFDLLCVCVCVSCLVVSNSATPQTTAPPGPSVHGILQARTLEWVTISSSKRNYRKKESEVTQSCPTLCDPMDYNLPGFSVHGISTCKGMKLPTPPHTFFFYTMHKNDSKWIKKLKVRSETMKPLVGNIGGNLLDLGLGNEFFGIYTKSTGN